MKKFVSLLLIILSFGIVPIIQAQDDSWPSIHNDSQNSGFSQGSGPSDNQTFWIVPFESIQGVAPVVAEGIIFLVSLDNSTLYAINSTTSEVIWQNEEAMHSRYRYHSPVVAHDMVFFADGAGGLA